MKRIPLSREQHALVSEEDYDNLSRYKWSAQWYESRQRYVAYRTEWNGKKQRRIYMHRYIASPPDAVTVDHINGNPLDNRRENLRFATISQQAQNRRKPSLECASTYKGVTWHRAAGRWMASICLNRKRIYLGLCADEVDAATVYNIAAVLLFDEYSLLNKEKP